MKIIIIADDFRYFEFLLLFFICEMALHPISET